MTEEGKTPETITEPSSKNKVAFTLGHSRRVDASHAEDRATCSKEIVKGDRKIGQKLVYRGYETLNSIKSELLNRNEVLIQKTFAALKKKMQGTKHGRQEKVDPRF